LDQTLIALNKIKKENVQNADISISYKMVLVLQHNKILFVSQELANVVLENAYNVKKDIF
jgi:hypothetical protein